MLNSALSLLAVFGIAATQRVCAQTEVDMAPLMPRVEDYTHMWWADGFPSHTPAARWLRCIQTGSYAFVLDTEAMRVPHFGAIPGGDYGAAAAGGERGWEKLPAADLKLGITVDGKAYHCTAGGKASRWGGPRLVESGRFFQRADVTDLTFTAADGAVLNVDARFETAAWPDRLALILAARPGIQAIRGGEASFGRVGGGFGLDGANHIEIPHSPEIDPEQFTLALWAFVPADYRVSARTPPWLVCKNHHEEAEGNFGILIVNGKPQARLNIGGGAGNAFTVEASSGNALKMDAWNHLAISYDGSTLRLFVNGKDAGSRKIDRKRKPGRYGMAVGRRQDNSGDGYHFRGVVDEIRIYDRALITAEVERQFSNPDTDAPELKAAGEWTFRADGVAALSRSREQWKGASIEVSLAPPQAERRGVWTMDARETWGDAKWNQASLVLDPVAFEVAEPGSPVTVGASELPGGAPRTVEYDPTLGWHRVNLDGINPIAPPGTKEARNDAIERVKLVLTNPTDRTRVARLMFEKTAQGFRQSIGTPITGVSAILRDPAGNPTGIPVQLSKNWHNEPEGGVHAGQWFHGISQVRLPAKANVELELTVACGHWGGVAAASHAQLCLIGWGSNQFWEQSALGAWGESICFEPDQVQANCTITDVRPLMVRAMGKGDRWGWTSNAGGGDFFRFFDQKQQRMAHAAMRSAYHRPGPCLTEVTHAGRLGEGITHATTISLARTDDLVRGTYHLRLDVKKAADFSRFVIFQTGADSYNYTSARKMALGNESGLIREWAAQWGGNTNRTAPMECTGSVPWVSLHEAVADESHRNGAAANRGIVIRSWKARLGGVDAAPWIVERGGKTSGSEFSTLDLVPPPGVARLEPGDFVDATIEHIVVPMAAGDYYGPNAALRAALDKDGNTWRMIHREATGNEHRAEMKTGELRSRHPSITVSTVDDTAEFTMASGLGYVPITFSGLTSPRGHALLVDGRPVDQSMHGNDFWQTDYDPAAKRWSRTYNVPLSDGATHTVRFERQP